MNTRILGLAAGLAVLFASTSWAQSITVAIGSEPSTLDPQLRDDGGERQVNDNIYEALMARTATGDLVPGLAADAPTQVDARTWQFKLREGIKFHNGEPFNADAVVASVLRVIDPANNSEQMAYLGPLSGAEKVDDLTVRIITSAPDPILPARMYWLKMVPAAYSKNATAIAEKPVGTGPYKFGTWDRGNSITMTANTDYWGGEPQIDDVTYRFVSEAGTRLSGLVAGEFDVVVNLLPEFADSVPQAKSVSGLETSVIILGVDNPAVKDVRVRRALNMAIDRHALAESLFAGNAKVTTGQLVLPGAFGYNESLENWPYDPQGAKKLIAEAGAAGTTIDLVGEAGRWLKDREATTWQFKLRDGVKFHNGEPFNADAVVASVSRVIDPANNSEQMAYFGTIKTAEKVDDLTVNLVTTGPDPILPSRMYWMKMIAPGYAKDGDLAGAPVGTGPYKFDSWNRGTDLKLVANADYWGGEPQIDDVTYRFVTEPGTRLSGLLSGEFDVITNLLPEFTTNVPKFAAVPGLETSVFVLGTDNEVTKDPKVREALNLAIDRKAMAEGLFMGYATLAKGSHINPAAFGFNEKLEHYPHDIEKARAP